MDLREWSRGAMDQIKAELRSDPHWEALLEDRADRSVHLAIFVEPFLGDVISGKKTVESRFSVRRYAPYRRVVRGDIVLVKGASGPVRGVCEVGATRFDELDSEKLEAIRREHGEAMRAADDAFWEACRDARYVSLIELCAFRPVTPITCPKRDRRGWVVLQQPMKEARPSIALRKRPSGHPPTW